MKIDRGYIRHIIKCLRGQISQEVIELTISELEKSIQKEEERIKTKESNGCSRPMLVESYENDLLAEQVDYFK
jgi:hypothetical protein